MSIQSNFYQTRATEEREKALASTLDNVREGHLRAAAAWDALAARSMKADRMRADEERRKSEVRGTDEAPHDVPGAELLAADIPEMQLQP